MTIARWLICGVPSPIRINRYRNRSYLMKDYWRSDSELVLGLVASIRICFNTSVC